MQLAVQHIISTDDLYENIENQKTCPGYKKYIIDPIKLLNLGNDILKPIKENYNDMLLDVFNIDLIYNNSSSYNKAYIFCDTLFTNYYDSRDLKILKEKNYTDTYIENLVIDCRKFLKRDLIEHIYGSIDDFYLARIKSSSKFEEIIKDMDKRITYDINNKKNYNEEYSLPKLKYFSAHDMSLASFISSLHYIYKFDTKDIFFDYASEVRIELTLDNKKKYFVSIIYNDLILVDSVKYNDFKSKVTNKIIVSQEDKNKFCSLQPIANNSILLVIKGSIIILSLICLFLLIYILFKKIYPITNQSNTVLIESNIKMLKSIYEKVET